MVTRPLALVVGLALMVGGCASGTTEPSQSAASTETSGGASPEPPRAVFRSNVKYDVLDVLMNRGAVAPVIETFSCTWKSETAADCAGVGYDKAQEASECGYELLPCGGFRLEASAICADARGHGCEIELRTERLDAGTIEQSPTEQTSTADVLHPPPMPATLGDARACGSVETPDGLAYDVYLVEDDGSFGCDHAQNVVA